MPLSLRGRPIATWAEDPRSGRRLTPAYRSLRRSGITDSGLRRNR